METRCSTCGANLPGELYFCPICGAPLRARPDVPAVLERRDPVYTWLIPNIAATIFGSRILGLLGVVLSLFSERARRLGELDKALNRARAAQILFTASALIGVALTAFGAYLEYSYLFRAE